MEEKYLTSFDGTKLYVRVNADETDKAILVMQHGLGEYSGTLAYAADRLKEQGIGTYLPDHRGHGRSEGERAYYSDKFEIVDDFHETVKLATLENPGKPVFLYGHSMGGYTVVMHGLRYPEENIAGIITSGAVTYDHQGIFRNVPKGQDVHIKMPNNLTTEICTVLSRVEAFRADPMATLFTTTGLSYVLCDGLDWMAERLGEFSFPVFMTHGEKDPIVSVQDTYDFYDEAASEDKQMKIYGGCHHAIFNEFCRDEVIDDIASWVLHRC